MKILRSQLMGNWYPADGDTPAILHNPTTEEPIGQVSSSGIDFGAVVEHSRMTGGSALRDDQMVNIADAIFLLEFLFTGGNGPVCPDAGDSNDDGLINIGDAINLLSFLFTGGSMIPYPYPGYGIDPTPDSLGDCLP